MMSGRRPFCAHNQRSKSIHGRLINRNAVVCFATQRQLIDAGLSTALGLVLVVAGPAHAELNKLEAATSGEFGMGSAQQYGEADIKDRDFSNQVRNAVG
jgi:hypothetical protein